MNAIAARFAALALAITLVSVPEEIAIGRQADAQVRKEVPALRDTASGAYVTAIGRRLAGVAAGPSYPYSFSIANYKEINAFALPGGPVWINRGTLQAATSESQVAGVLAHEIAHVARRHAADQLTKTMIANWGLGLLGAVLGNTGGASAAQVAARLIASGAFLEFSRDDEADADRVGLQILTRAGWDGRGMIEMFQILQRESARNPSQVEVFLSTHPAPADRIATLRGDLAHRRAGGRRDSEQFHAIKTRLGKMAAARPMPQGH
jgi:predicted Zn-dependent protease